MVVMGGKDKATVVSATFNFGYDVETLIALKELIVDVDGDAFGIFWETIWYPNDGLVHALSP